MVGIAQLVESRIVIPVVVGSSPISHPRTKARTVTTVRAFFIFPLETEVLNLSDLDSLNTSIRLILHFCRHNLPTITQICS